MACTDEAKLKAMTMTQEEKNTLIENVESYYDIGRYGAVSSLEFAIYEYLTQGKGLFSRSNEDEE